METREKLSGAKNCGYLYVSADNKSMVEFQVDHLPLIHEYATTIGFRSFPGNLQSLETGFGERISQFQLDEINYTRHGQTNIYVDAALAIHGQALKMDLEQPIPICCIF